ATLSADTTDRSAQFWASLQSDILGDTIAIHGTNDKVISLPIGATALDGAFYLLGKKALSVSTINVDGKETQFAIPIENAASLDFSMTNSQTFTREWLDWVHTGYATAIIRETLGQQSDYHKIRAGKKLLQDTLGEHKKGFIEEFDQEGIKNALTAIGYSSLKDTYIALADGHLDPEEVYNAIFHPKDIAKGGRATLSILRYTRTMNDGELLNRIIQAYKNYRVSFKTIHQQHKSKSNTEVITVKAMLTPEQRKSIVADLKAVGADNVSCTASLPTLAYHLGIILLIALWGLDPLFAHYILDHISAYDLTLIRFVMLFIGATLMYTFQKILSKQKLKPISPKDTSIIVSALALFLTGLTSYLSLTLIPPDQYILIIIGGITLAALIKNLFTPKAKIVHLVVSLLAVIISATLLIQTEGYVLIGLMLAIASSFGFVLYSQISSKYQKGTLHARYPAFIFWISVIILPFLLLLLPYTQILSLSAPILITSLLYVLIFAVTPYALYFECMRNVSGETLDHALPFVFVSTIIGEMILNQSLIQLITIPLIFVFLWQYMVIQKENN
ncbi:hypothetical protein KJ652_01810, partial [Patescibacteria group bacterium]|nr:hypothetical protein [Patescibacteria group bacterium]